MNDAAEMRSAVNENGDRSLVGPQEVQISTSGQIKGDSGEGDSHVDPIEDPDEAPSLARFLAAQAKSAHYSLSKNRPSGQRKLQARAESPRYSGRSTRLLVLLAPADTTLPLLADLEGIKDLLGLTLGPGTRHTIN